MKLFDNAKAATKKLSVFGKTAKSPKDSRSATDTKARAAERDSELERSEKVQKNERPENSPRRDAEKYSRASEQGTGERAARSGKPRDRSSRDSKSASPDSSAHKKSPRPKYYNSPNSMPEFGRAGSSERKTEPEPDLSAEPDLAEDYDTSSVVNAFLNDDNSYFDLSSLDRESLGQDASVFAESDSTAVEADDFASAPLKKSSDTILALDIGTEYVKAVIARQAKDDTLDVIGVGRAHQAATNMYAGAIADIPAVISVCERALSQAERMAGVSSKLVVVGIAGELIKGDTHTIRYRRKNGNKPLSEQEMALIIKRVQDRAGEQARKAIADETNNPAVEVRLINSAIVNISIDGYKISNPIGFKGTDVVIEFYTAFAPLVHISAIEKVCAELSLDLLAVAVEPFAVCRACLGDDLDSNFSAIVMDIGGGTTDIAVVDDGGVEGTKMFNIGGRSFTHQIAVALGIDFDSAEKYKLSIRNPAKVPADLRDQALMAIQHNLAVWLSGVEIVLEEFDLSDMLPSRILLCGGGAGLIQLQDVLATTDWFKDLPFARRPVVHLVDSADLPGIRNHTKIPLNYSYITALGLLRVALDTLVGAPEGSGLRAKFAKLLQN